MTLFFALYMPMIYVKKKNVELTFFLLADLLGTNLEKRKD